EHYNVLGQSGLEKITDIIESPTSVGIVEEHLVDKSKLDLGISEFCRFYTERLKQEIKSAGNDPRKIKKIEDDFTPRLEITLVGLEGTVRRKLSMHTTFKFDDSDMEYSSVATLCPSRYEIINIPENKNCEKTNKNVPKGCLAKCEISGLRVLRHLLVASEISGRLALPEHTVLCSLSGKRVLEDEVEKSAISGQLVSHSLLKTSALSGKRAEPQFFSKCEFTSSEVLENELAVSQVSGKKYRIDEQLQSEISGKTGFKQEFIFCSETKKPLLLSEAEKCEVTGKFVLPGILEQCEVSGKKVLPSELEKCAATGKKALKKFFVTSSLSNALIIEQEAIRSIAGKFCVPLEAKLCFWSGNKYHPDDLKICDLTGVSVHFQYTSRYKDGLCLEPLKKLLDGTQRKADKSKIWSDISKSVSEVLNGKNYEVESAELSPDSCNLAVCLTVKTWLGFKLRYTGILFTILDNTVTGKALIGKRENGRWIEEGK
ncbi:MAG: hypothetical protein PHP62_05960, partial [Candidatus Moranbacteria bacterium]|nr:hypothetical protein [Candidatus Moranbacteria bacterium]